MKKFILSIAAMAIMGLVNISCASHTTVRTYNDPYGNYQSQGSWKRCVICDGKGSCGACKGTGRISGDACRTCKGTGKCNTCKGQGGYFVD